MALSKSVFWAAPVLLGVASPAMAIGDEAAACPAGLIEESTKTLLTEFIASQEDEMPDAIPMDLAAATTVCAGQYDLSEEETEAVMMYTLSSLIAAAAGNYLADVGVPTNVINETLDVGPGRTNAQPLNFTAENAEALTAALAEQGVDVENLPETTWNQVGVYLASVLDQQTILLPFRD